MRNIKAMQEQKKARKSNFAKVLLGATALSSMTLLGVACTSPAGPDPKPTETPAPTEQSWQVASYALDGTETNQKAITIVDETMQFSQADADNISNAMWWISRINADNGSGGFDNRQAWVDPDQRQRYNAWLNSTSPKIIIHENDADAKFVFIDTGTIAMDASYFDAIPTSDFTTSASMLWDMLQAMHDANTPTAQILGKTQSIAKALPQIGKKSAVKQLNARVASVAKNSRVFGA